LRRYGRRNICGGTSTGRCYLRNGRGRGRYIGAYWFCNGYRVCHWSGRRCILLSQFLARFGFLENKKEKISGAFARMRV
jgi:hypothetical protein